MKRKPITARDKIRSLLYWTTVYCPECQNMLFPNDDIEWDHRHAVCFDGEDHYTNIRALHATCHTQKTIRDIKANAKVKRLEAKRTGKPERRKKKWASRPMQSRNSFQRSAPK